MMLFILTVLEWNNVPRGIRRIIGNKNLKTNILRIQAYDSVIWEYFCIGFINYMHAGLPHDFKKMS